MTDQNQSTDPQAQGTQKNDQNQDQNNQDSNVFGGSGDIFENSDLLEPIKEVGNKNDEDEKIDGDNIVSEGHSDDVFETKQNASIVDEHDTEENDTAENKHGEPEIVESMPETPNKDNNSDDDFFDPFGDDTKEVEEEKEDSITDVIPTIDDTVIETIPEVEEIEEVKEEIVTEPMVEDDVPNFDESPEIDALDDIDKLSNLNESELETELESVKKLDEEKEKKEKTKIDIGSTIERIEKRAKEAKLEAEKRETLKKENRAKTEEAVEIEKITIEDNTTEDVSEDVVEDVVEETPEEIETNIVDEEESIEIKKDDPLKTDLQNKFSELLDGVQNIYKLLDKDIDSGFDIVGGNDDRLKTTYNIVVEEDNIKIKKIELNKADDTTQEYKLEFVVNKASLNVNVDDELLYDEITDLQENVNKKMQVMEKLNKFIFLVSEEFKKLEKEKGKKAKRNIIKGIFRNFMF